MFTFHFFPFLTPLFNVTAWLSVLFRSYNFQNSFKLSHTWSSNNFSQINFFLCLCVSPFVFSSYWVINGVKRKISTKIKEFLGKIFRTLVCLRIFFDDFPQKYVIIFNDEMRHHACLHFLSYLLHVCVNTDWWAGIWENNNVEKMLLWILYESYEMKLYQLLKCLCVFVFASLLLLLFYNIKIGVLIVSFSR